MCDAKGPVSSRAVLRSAIDRITTGTRNLAGCLAEVVVLAGEDACSGFPRVRLPQTRLRRSIAETRQHVNERALRRKEAEIEAIEKESANLERLIAQAEAARSSWTGTSKKRSEAFASWCKEAASRQVDRRLWTELSKEIGGTSASIPGQESQSEAIDEHRARAAARLLTEARSAEEPLQTRLNADRSQREEILKATNAFQERVALLRASEASIKTSLPKAFVAYRDTVSLSTAMITTFLLGALVVFAVFPNQPTEAISRSILAVLLIASCVSGSYESYASAGLRETLRTVIQSVILLVGALIIALVALGQWRNTISLNAGALAVLVVTLLAAVTGIGAIVLRRSRARTAVGWQPLTALTLVLIGGVTGWALYAVGATEYARYDDQSTFSKNSAPAVIDAQSLKKLFQTSSPIVVAWRPGESAGHEMTFDVREKTIAPSGKETGMRLVVKHAAQGSTTLPLRPGFTYCLAVRARSVASGRVSGWSHGRCVVRAIGVSRLKYQGLWQHVRASRAFGGSFIATDQSGAKVSRFVVARRVSVIATRCSSCGSIVVYFSGKVVARVSLRSRRTIRAVALRLKSWKRPRRGIITIVVTSSGRRVDIYGLGVSPKVA